MPRGAKRFLLYNLFSSAAYGPNGFPRNQGESRRSCVSAGYRRRHQMAFAGFALHEKTYKLGEKLSPPWGEGGPPTFGASQGRVSGGEGWCTAEFGVPFWAPPKYTMPALYLAYSAATGGALCCVTGSSCRCDATSMLFLCCCLLLSVVLCSFRSGWGG